jgi:hypothetical protein
VSKHQKSKPDADAIDEPRRDVLKGIGAAASLAAIVVSPQSALAAANPQTFDPKSAASKKYLRVFQWSKI